MRKFFLILMPFVFISACSIDEKKINEVNSGIEIDFDRKFTFEQYVNSLIENDNLKKYPDINNVK